MVEIRTEPDTGHDDDDISDSDEDHQNHRHKGEVFANHDLTKRRWRHTPHLSW